MNNKKNNTFIRTHTRSHIFTNTFWAQKKWIWSIQFLCRKRKLLLVIHFVEHSQRDWFNFNELKHIFSSFRLQAVCKCNCIRTYKYAMPCRVVPCLHTVEWMWIHIERQSTYIHMERKTKIRCGNKQHQRASTVRCGRCVLYTSVGAHLLKCAMQLSFIRHVYISMHAQCIADCARHMR